jgi:hypothetical protein
MERRHLTHEIQAVLDTPLFANADVTLREALVALRDLTDGETPEDILRQTGLPPAYCVRAAGIGAMLNNTDM